MKSLAAIHAGRKQLGLDEDAYRDLLRRVTGKASSRDMSEGERGAVLAEMRRLGFAPAARSSARRATGPWAGKLQALWIAAHNLGVVHEKDDAAMLAFVARQTGLSHTRFLRDAVDAAKAIEALKSWLAREAGVDWSTGERQTAHFNDPRYQIAAAQWRKLIAVGAVAPYIAGTDDLVSLETAYGYRVTGKAAFQFYGPADWITLMNALGRKLRAALAKKAQAA